MHNDVGNSKLAYALGLARGIIARIKQGEKLSTLDEEKIKVIDKIIETTVYTHPYDQKTNG